MGYLLEGVTMVWQVILCGLLAVSESGDWSAIIKAQQLFHEVYGKKIEAAKTPEAKAALAKELLELAKKETDQLAKRVELEQAKKWQWRHAISVFLCLLSERQLRLLGKICLNHL